MISALDSGVSDPGSSPGRGHCVVFLGKTFYSHNASLHPGVHVYVFTFSISNNKLSLFDLRLYFPGFLRGVPINSLLRN